MTDPSVQPPGECPSCRAAIAPDQRYCLSCGARQSEPRVPFSELLERSPATAVTGAPGHSAPSGGAPPRDWTPVVALGGLAALVLVLVIGVLIGRSGQSNAPKLAAAPSVITVQGGAPAPAAVTPTTATATASATGSVASINDDWPSGKTAYTVQLMTIAKAGATALSVNSAKSAATGKGAPAVGVLDAANYNSLGSAYILYSGDYSTKAKANAALAKVKKSFPTAKVIHVVPSGGGSTPTPAAPVSAAQQAAGAAAISTLSNCAGASCSKAARTVTNPIATSGAPAKKDNRPAGGGSTAQTIN